MNKKIGLRFLGILLGIILLFNSSYALNDNDLFSYWKFDENTSNIAYDSVGTNDLTFTGSPSWTTGKINTALNFASGDGVYKSSPDLSFTNNTWSVSLWVKFDTYSSSSIYTLIQKNYDGTSVPIYLVQQNGELTLGFYKSGTWYRNLDSWTPSTNTWYHIVGTYDQQNLKIYIDGSLSSAVPTTETLPTGNTRSLSIGFRNSDWEGGGNNYYLDGSIDEPAIWDRPLNSNEVLELYNNGSGLQYPFGSDIINLESIKANNETFLNNSWFSTTNILFDLNLSVGTGASNPNTTIYVYKNNSLYYTETINEDLTPSFNITTFTDSGSRYNISWYSINNVTNSTFGNYSIIVDLTPPTINNSLPLEWFSYNINLSNYISCYDIESGTCNITFLLDGVSVPTNTTSYNFTYNGNQTYDIIARDTAGNTVNESGYIFVNPQFYVYFEDEDSNPVYNFTINDTSYEYYFNDTIYTYGLGTHEFEFKKEGYANERFNLTFNTTSDINDTVSVGFVYININLFYRVNGSVFDIPTQITIQGLVNTSTSNGTLSLHNDSFASDTYTVQAVSEGYYTEQKVFIYDGENNVNVSLYLLNETAENSASLSAYVEDDLFYRIPNANTKLLEYDSSILGFKEVGQCYTNSEGACKFLIEVGTKTYIVYSSIVVDGITYEGYSTTNGEIFQPNIIGGAEVVSSFYERTITLSLSGFYDANFLYGLNINAPINEDETIVSENESVTVLSIPVSWSSTNNLDYTICLNFYRVIEGNKTSFLSSRCGTGSNGILLPSTNINLDNDYDYVIDITIEYDNEKVTYKTYRYKSNTSLNEILGNLAIVSPIILFLWVALLSFALWIKKIIVFAIGSFGLSGLTLALFPNFLVGAGLVTIYLISIGIIYLGRTERDLS